MPYRPIQNRDGSIMRDLRDVSMEDWGNPSVSEYAAPLASEAFGNEAVQGLHGQLLKPGQLLGLTGMHSRIRSRGQEPAFFQARPDYGSPLSMGHANALRPALGKPLANGLPMARLRGLR